MYLPPSRIKLAAMAFLLVVGFIAMNKICTGKYMPTLWEFNRFITPSFEPVKHFFKSDIK